MRKNALRKLAITTLLLACLCTASTLGAVSNNNVANPQLARSPIPPTIARPEPEVTQAETTNALGGTPVTNAEFEALQFIVPDTPIAMVDVVVESLDGTQVALSDYAGKVIALNLWATWCPPCREEMPSMHALYQELGESPLAENFVIMAVATPYPPQETEELIRAFAEEHQYAFPIFMDKTLELNSIYGTGSVPTTWIIDKAGHIRALKPGFFLWDSPEMVDLFQRLMAE